MFWTSKLSLHPIKVTFSKSHIQYILRKRINYRKIFLYINVRNKFGITRTEKRLIIFTINLGVEINPICFIKYWKWNSFIAYFIPPRLLYISDDERKKLKKTLLCMTAEIDAVCRKYDIKMFLVGGSLLGAIRHGGFIPWDDKLERDIYY